MKKKKISILGIVFILLLLILELNGINIDEFSTYLNSNDTTEQGVVDPDIKVNTIVESNLKIYFIDVGQADSILIQNKDENMLIDAGNNNDGDKLVSYFKSLGIKEFKYVVGTHPHEDHIGGLDNIIKSFSIDKVYLPDVITTTKTFEDVLIALEDKNMNFNVPKINENMSLGESSLNVLYTGTDEDDLNNSSIVLKLVFGNNSFLLTGDATSEIEELIIEKNIKADVLKIGHHGSRYSTSDSFLDKVNPQYAIISAGKNNSYKHPHTEILNKLEKRNIEIYRTDNLGTILVTSDGTNLEFNNYKTDTDG